MTTTSKFNIRICTSCQLVHDENERAWKKSRLGPFVVSHCPQCGASLHKWATPEKRQRELPLETTP